MKKSLVVSRKSLVVSRKSLVVSRWSLVVSRFFNYELRKLRITRDADTKSITNYELRGTQIQTKVFL
jgi:hypothetical protein